MTFLESGHLPHVINDTHHVSLLVERNVHFGGHGGVHSVEGIVRIPDNKLSGPKQFIDNTYTIQKLERKKVNNKRINPSLLRNLSGPHHGDLPWRFAVRGPPHQQFQLSLGIPCPAHTSPCPLQLGLLPWGTEDDPLLKFNYCMNVFPVYDVRDASFIYLPRTGRCSG